ncbi:hypothetical protein BGW80DRAFT_375934 [Lactifluus volemus]|nr:hypothetical protein BGW80DRAFT_375934 [Lactifluus volemus]
MSILAVLTTLSFFFGHALSQSATCARPGSWDWTFNSMGQDPCTVAALLESPCYGLTPSIPPLSPGSTYSGTTGSSYDGPTCMCSTVVYSLLSACAACQGGSWISWSNYIPNCSGSDLSIPYLYAIPNGTYVPYWARIDVTVKGTWDPDESRAVGDTPEAGPGAAINTPASSRTLSSSPQATHSPTATSSKTTGSSSNVGVIAGGVVGGVVVMSAIAFIFFFLGRRKHRQGSLTAPMFDAAPQLLIEEFRPQSSYGEAFVPPSLPETRAPPMRPYDPDDPTTFPCHQGANPEPKSHTQVPAASDMGHTLSDMPISPPPTYSALPTV